MILSSLFLLNELYTEKKLKYSNKANEELVTKLKSMEDLFKEMEQSSEGIREKLKKETKLRREAEKALTDFELEMKGKMVKNKHYERNDHSMLRIADSGLITETMKNTSKNFTDKEFEAMADELISTQEQLRKTEEQLLRSQALVQDLERNIQNIDGDAVAGLSGDDDDLMEELDLLRQEIGAVRSKEMKTGLVENKQSMQTTAESETELKKSRAENSRLKEEIACLRNILYEKGDLKLVGADGKEMKGYEEQQIEILSLRRQVEETFNENIALQETVRKLEILNASPGSLTEKLKKSQRECSEMRSEILNLTDCLYLANQEREAIDYEELKRQEEELLSARNELVDRDTDIRSLEADLATSEEHVQALTKEIARIQLDVEKYAELNELRAQYKTLSEKSETLLQQVEEVNGDVEVVREQQDKANEESKDRLALTKDLRDIIVDAVDETRQRNSEVEELALIMEKRMGSTELSIEALDSEIVLAMKKLHGDKLVLSGTRVNPLEIIIADDSDLESVEEEKEKEEVDTESNKTEEEEVKQDTFETEEKEEPVGFNSIESVLERTRRVIEVSETVDRLAIVSRKSKETDEGSLSTVSVSSRKAHTVRYEEIMQKLADYEAMYKNENRELEAIGDKGVEVRE